MIKKFNEYKSDEKEFDVEDILNIRDIFRDEILDEVEMVDLSDKDWVNDDDSIHEIIPEFTGETFYAFYENKKLAMNKTFHSKVKGVAILIKFGRYIPGSTDIQSSENKTHTMFEKEKKLIKSIDSFRKRIRNMGFEFKIGVGEVGRYSESDPSDIVLYTININ